MDGRARTGLSCERDDYSGVGLVCVITGVFHSMQFPFQFQCRANTLTNGQGCGSRCTTNRSEDGQTNGIEYIIDGAAFDLLSALTLMNYYCTWH